MWCDGHGQKGMEVSMSDKIPTVLFQGIYSEWNCIKTKPRQLCSPPRTPSCHCTTHTLTIMPAKRRCQANKGEQPCKSAALRIVGDCPHCTSHFCGEVSRHRRP